MTRESLDNFDGPYKHCPLDPAGHLLERNIYELNFCPSACLRDQGCLLTFHVGTDLQDDESFPREYDVDLAWFGEWGSAPTTLEELESKLDELSSGEKADWMKRAKVLVKRVKDEHIVRLQEADFTGERYSVCFPTHHVVVLQVRDTQVRTEVEEAVKQVQMSCEKDGVDSPLAKLRILGTFFASAMKSKVIRREAAKARMQVEIDEKFFTPRRVKVRYIVWPPCFFFMAFMFQSFMLHVCTHFYIKYMEKEKDEGLHGEGRLFDVIGNLVATTVAQESNTEAVKIPLWLLDVSGATPIALYMFANAFSLKTGSFSIDLWNKQFIVGAVMAFLKGVFDVVTVLPDSIGWDTCQDRLHKSGMRAFSHMNFLTDFWYSLTSMLFVELFGDGTVKRVRYCADMMISGHTYFALLFSIGAYNAIRLNSVTFGGVQLRRVVFWICGANLVTELLLVGLARFHYTVDMLAAIVLVICLYDSRTVDQIAADWSEGFRWRDPNHFVPRSSLQSVFLWCKGHGQVDQIRMDPAIVPSKAIHVMSMRDATGSPPWSDSSESYHHAKNAAAPTGTPGTPTGFERRLFVVDSSEILPSMP